MTTRFPRSLFAVLTLLCVCGGSMALQAQMLYSVTSMGTLGGPFTTPFAINNNGQVACQSYNSPVTAHACLWDGMLHDLGTLGGPLSGADSINNKGQLVGTAQVTGGLGSHAFLYSNGVMTDLGTLGGTISNADWINDNGQIVGQTFVNLLTFHAFLYDGTMHDLGTLGGLNSEAKGINNKGQIVGLSDTAANVNGGAFLYSGGVMINLGSLGGQLSGALAINDNGQIVGSSQTGGATHAFLYDGTMHDLGTLGGTCVANAINNSGQVVGYFSPTATTTRAFLYMNGTMTDLNNLLMPGSLPAGVSLAAATGINDHGQITAKGSDGLGYVLSLHGAGSGPLPPASIKPISGDGQSGPPGRPLPKPVVVVVVDNLGNPVAGATVAFGGTNATVSPASVQTDSMGLASAQVTLGASVGPAKLTGTVAGLAPVTFNFTVIQTATNLMIEKTWQATSAGNPRRGDTFTYTIQLTNGSAPAMAVSVQDTPDSRSELALQGLLTFNLGTLAPGASQTLTVQASASASGTYVNNAAVTWSDSSGKSATASVSTTTPVDPQPGDFAANLTASVPLKSGVRQVLADGPTVYVVNNPGDSLTVLICASGACNVTSTVALGAGANPIGVMKMDVDGDGQNDVLILNQGAGTITTLLSSSPGAPQVSSVGTGPAAFAPFLAGDGVPRVAVIFRGTITIFAWDGQQFRPAATAATGTAPSAVVNGDFNGDGADDLLVADEGTGTVQVFLGDGMGGLNPVNELAVGANARALAVGDMDNDGALDAAVITDSGLVVLINDGAANLAPQPAVPAPNAGAVVLADFNGDGNLDASVANTSGASVSFYRGDGSGMLTPAGTYLTGKMPVSLAALDVDNDGIADLVCGNSGSQDVVILLFPKL
jgi:uncharacterized repeat protein (TIGR01451 family)